MRLEELISFNELKAYVSNVGPRLALVKAKDTAEKLALSESRKKAVHVMFNVCNQLSDSELTDFRAQLGIEGIFEKLADDEKMRFCNETFSELRVG